MSTLLANVCLVIATVVFSILFLPVFHTKISTSNDQGATGYMMILMFIIHLVFLGLISLAYISIARQGGLEWIAKNSMLRFLLIAVGLLSTLLLSAFSMANRLANDPDPGILLTLTRLAPIIILVVIVGSGFILNNPFLRESVPTALYKWPIISVAGLSFVGIISLCVGLFVSGSKGAEDATRKYESAEGIKNNRLREIGELDAKTDMVRILEFTGALYPTEVREKASSKFKTNPDWQHDLINLLENDYALEAYNFLQSNEVSDKKIFAEPVNAGIHAVALRIRHDIQGTNSSDFNRDMFSDEVNRVLRTVEKFEGMGVDYLPAVKELRLALDEPTSKKNVKYNCASTLDIWIDAHDSPR